MTGPGGQRARRSAFRRRPVMLCIVGLAVTLVNCTAGNPSRPTVSVSSAVGSDTVLVGGTPSGAAVDRTSSGARAVTAPGGPVLASEPILQAAGISTVTDESATVPLQSVSGGAALAATNWQLQNMTAEAAAHGGILGADLDRVLPMGGAPPLAFVIGGWIAAAGDPTARAAGRIIGTQNWYQAENVVFPLEVLDLFVADVMSHSGSATIGGGSRSLSTRSTQTPLSADPPTSQPPAPLSPTAPARPPGPTASSALR